MAEISFQVMKKARAGQSGASGKRSGVTARLGVFAGVVLDLEFPERTSMSACAVAALAMTVLVPIMVTAPVFASVVCHMEDNDCLDIEALAVPAFGTGNAFKTVGVRHGENSFQVMKKSPRRTGRRGR
jgi:hypothetical protein